MVKKVYLIHGWGGSSRGGWFDWLRDRLLEKKIEVRAFDMPDTDHPNKEKWVDFIKQNILPLDSDTYFVGHSIGCQAIMRFLETIEDEEIKIKGCVFVAGWFTLYEDSLVDEEEKQVASPWLNTQIDFKKVKEHCKNFLAIFSDDDPFVPVTDEKLFQKFLGAKTIMKHGEDHFNKKYEMPEILNFILQ